MSEFTDKEVAAVLKFHAEYGCYPRNAKPEAVAMAERLRAASVAVSDSVASQKP